MLLQTYLSEQRSIELEENRNMDTSVDNGEYLRGK
jgi:hypothetical protein